MSAGLAAGGLYLALDRRGAVVSVMLLALLAAASVLSLGVGDFPITPGEILGVLRGEGDSVDRMIVLSARLPRLLCAIGAGLALGLAGTVTQTLLRNPLASPDIVGITAGASLGAILSVWAFGGASAIVLGASLGGLAAAALVMLLAWRDGISAWRLILVGIGVNLCLGAVSDVLIARIDILEATDLIRWLVGSLNARDWSDVRRVWLVLAFAAPLVVWAGFWLSRLGLSDDVAAGLGLRLTPLRVALIGFAVLLVAAAISVAGPLPFVAFVAGPIARSLLGQARPALVQAGIIGALICVLADLAGRSAMPGYSLPTGIFTALIGAPVLIWFLVANIRKRAI